MTNAIITPELVDLDLKAADRHAATRQLAQRLAGQGRVTDVDSFPSSSPSPSSGAGPRWLARSSAARSTATPSSPA